MKGKELCEFLKSIRQKIADANGIPYTTRECTHKGDCPGTCPLCDAELDDLQQKIDAMVEEGKKVNLNVLTDEEKQVFFSQVDLPLDEEDGEHILMGDVAPADEWEDDEVEVTMGMPAMPREPLAGIPALPDDVDPVPNKKK